MEYERGKCYADEIGAAFFETSAKTRQNIDEGFHEIVRRIRYRQRYSAEQEEEAARRKAAFVWYALKFSALPVEVVKRIAEEVALIGHCLTRGKIDRHDATSFTQVGNSQQLDST